LTGSDLLDRECRQRGSVGVGWGDVLDLDITASPSATARYVAPVGDYGGAHRHKFVTRDIDRGVKDPPGLSFEASDEQLLVSSVEHPELFAVFYQRHGRDLLAFFARRTFDPEIAADLTAETFAKAFASRPRFRARSAGGARAWLYTIARRELARMWRRHRVETKARDRLGLPVRTLAEDDYERIERLIDFESVGRAVAGALSRLSSEQRDAVTLRVIEGRSYAEVARAIGCSELAARARVSRGLSRLAALLEP
jgi:RNA polymerase sigma factor (sigma-70 family)